MPARLIAKETTVEQQLRGRFSDGSDRTVVSQTHWTVTVRAPNGEVRSLTFDHDPTDQEIVDGLPVETALVPTRKGALEEYMLDLYAAWRRWEDTRAEAVARSAPAAVQSALTTKTNGAWTDYLAALNTWRTAP